MQIRFEEFPEIESDKRQKIEHFVPIEKINQRKTVILDYFLKLSQIPNDIDLKKSLYFNDVLPVKNSIENYNLKYWEKCDILNIRFIVGEKEKNIPYTNFLEFLRLGNREIGLSLKFMDNIKYTDIWDNLSESQKSKSTPGFVSDTIYEGDLTNLITGLVIYTETPFPEKVIYDFRDNIKNEEKKNIVYEFDYDVGLSLNIGMTFMPIWNISLLRSYWKHGHYGEISKRESETIQRKGWMFDRTYPEFADNPEHSGAYGTDSIHFILFSN